MLVRYIIKESLDINSPLNENQKLEKVYWLLEKVGLYDKNLRRAQDLDLWLRAINLNYKFFIIDKPLIFYKRSN